MVTDISGFVFHLHLGWLSCILVRIVTIKQITKYIGISFPYTFYLLNFYCICKVCLLSSNIIYMCPISFFLDHSCKRFIWEIVRGQKFLEIPQSINVLNHWHLLWCSYFYPRIFNWSTKLLLCNMLMLWTQNLLYFCLLFLLFFFLLSLRFSCSLFDVKGIFIIE